MRKVLYMLAVMVACGSTAPLAWATTASTTGAQVEFGAVHANAGTLYSVQNSGGSSTVSIIGTAGWNTCTSGYTPVGYDFEQNGFWLCARHDLASQQFYVGNVVNDAGYWWGVHGGTATSDGSAGWNYCPSSATLLGTEFNSNGFWLCYVPPPPPSPSPAPTPAPSGGGTTTVVPPASSPPTATPKPQLSHVHARIVLRWAWEGAQTWLTGLQFSRLPRNATVIVTCRGKGCPKGLVRVSAHQLRQLRRRLVNHHYRRGDHITIKVITPGAVPEVASIVIRQGRMPRAGLLRR